MPGNAPPRAPGELAEIEAKLRFTAEHGHVCSLDTAECAVILASLRSATDDGGEAIRAEMPETLNTGNLVHDVRTLRMAHDSMHRHAYRWGKAALLLLPFVDMAAGEGLEFSEQEDGAPRMDAAELCVAFAKAMGCDLGDAAYTAMMEEGRQAIRALQPRSTKIEGAGEL